MPAPKKIPLVCYLAKEVSQYVRSKSEWHMFYTIIYLRLSSELVLLQDLKTNLTKHISKRAKLIPAIASRRAVVLGQHL